MNNQYYALYYPTIEFQDYAWLYSAALLWDRIYRIVPSSYIPDDPDNIKALIDTGEIGIPINPDPYAKEIAEEFIDKLRTEHWDAAALTYDIPEDYMRLHSDKVDVKLRELIVAQGEVQNNNEWLHVPVEFGAHYMTYLSNRVAEDNELSILTDSSPAWTASTYFKYDGGVQDFPMEDDTHLLAATVIRDFLPQNISTLRPKDIISYREKYRDERKRFMSAMRSAATRISACDDPHIVQDLIRDIKKDVESSLEDYRNSLKVLNITALAGIKSLTFPAAAKIASEVSGQGISVETLAIISGLGLGFGVVSGFSEWSQRRRNLSKESDYSYLLHLRRNWRKCAMYNNDYNYDLCRQMEEFIND